MESSPVRKVLPIDPSTPCAYPQGIDVNKRSASAQRDAELKIEARARRIAHDHVLRVLALGHAGRLSQFCFDDEAIAVLGLTLPVTSGLSFPKPA
jgi:hypothetical protein